MGRGWEEFRVRIQELEYRSQNTEIRIRS